MRWASGSCAAAAQAPHRARQVTPPNFILSTRQIDWTSAADGACMLLVARGRSEPRVPQPQPVVPTGLGAVTAPAGAGTPNGGSDHEAISQYSRGQERRPRDAQAQVGPQIIHAA